MLNVCVFCHVKEVLSAEKWFAPLDCAGRRINPTAFCKMCADKGWAPSSGSRDPKLPSPFACRARTTIECVSFREAPLEDYKKRPDPISARKDIFTARPSTADIRRTPPAEVRGALLRVRRRRPLANTPGAGDVSGRGSDVPSEGTS